ncbi:MAG: hypothetical protein AB7T31_12585 [Gemmatimonadales bacterium]
MTRLTNHSNIRIALFAIFATLVGPSTQAQAQDVFVSLELPARPAAAVEMEQQADDLLVAGRGWERAAGLYRRAAELRGSDDVKSADNLRMAGYLQFYRGRPKAAVLTLMQAGEAFLALGDVERAAEAFIDGAWVATRADMPVEARDLRERGRLLTRSPLLQVEDRTALVRRLGETAGQ